MHHHGDEHLFAPPIAWPGDWNIVRPGGDWEDVDMLIATLPWVVLCKGSCMTMEVASYVLPLCVPRS